MYFSFAKDKAISQEVREAVVYKDRDKHFNSDLEPTIGEKS